MVLFAEERLGLGPEGFGLLVTANGVGGVVAVPVVDHVLRRVSGRPGSTVQDAAPRAPPQTPEDTGEVRPMAPILCLQCGRL